MNIPTKFYLRTQSCQPRGCKKKSIYTYWNYRNTVSGVCVATSKVAAKRIIVERYPEAEFYR